ncbi:MAG: helix-turn-helix domain-containing protein, partial [Thaumarchaeota archaeon]|nr:helix-turn-helix domain-containing protein [Nitrososphaerota archaeon]
MDAADLLTVRGKILLYLAEHGALVGGLQISTVKLAEEIGVSQQTVSRTLIELEKQGLVERSGAGRTWIIKLTERGLKGLLEMHTILKKTFETPVEIELEGYVFTGLGEGA